MPNGFRTVFTAPREVMLEPQEFGPPGPGKVLLRTERTLISTGTELTGLIGEFPPGSAWAAYMRYPFGAGYSNAATVQEVGEGVERVKVGDRVASSAPHATYAVSDATHLRPIPPGVDAEVAAFATLVEIAMGGVRLSRLMFGEAAVIIGAGLVGQLATHLCHLAGAWPIIVIDPAEHRLPTALRMGATHTLPLLVDAARPEVESITKGRKADVVFEVTGNPIAMAGAVKLARRRGRIMLLGSPRGPVTIDLHDEVHNFGLEIIGAHNSAHPPAETPNNPWSVARHVELFLDLQNAGVIDVRPLITHRYPWRQTPEAYQMLLSDRSQALGVILDWSDPGE
jgi:2-desacetyl-2-hydroxyethyl bacteriochlorophyllide A dehydrogenase